MGCPLKEILWLRFAHNYIHAEAAYVFFGEVASADGEDDNLRVISAATLMISSRVSEASVSLQTSATSLSATKSE